MLNATFSASFKHREPYKNDDNLDFSWDEKELPDLRGRLAFTLFWTMLLVPLRQQNNQVPWETELQSSKVILSTSELQIGSSKNLKSLLFFRK